MWERKTCFEGVFHNRGESFDLSSPFSTVRCGKILVATPRSDLLLECICMGIDEHLPYIRCETFLFFLIFDTYPHIHSPYDYDELKILYLIYVNRFKLSCREIKIYCNLSS
jgi:hypothetical protein